VNIFVQQITVELSGRK